MADEYGKIYKRIWGDPDFCGLPERAQLLYLKFISQPDVSLAGVLTLAPVRWAKQSLNVTTRQIDTSIQKLIETGFIRVDYDTQEVLIRSYIRQDAGWRSAKTLKGIVNSVRRVLSPSLRAAISCELQRINTSTLPETVNKGYQMTVREYVESEISQLVEENPPHGVSHGVSDTPSDGVSHGVSGAGPLTIATTTTPTTATTKAFKAEAPAKTDFEEFYAIYPRKMKRGDAEKAYAAALKRASADDIISGAQRLATDPNLPDKKYIPYPATWLRADGWADEPLPPQNGTSPNLSTTDDRVAGWMNLAQQTQPAETGRLEIAQ